jgi:4-oxalocrotonate tautomerase
MPLINIRITRDGATAEQKAALIQGATQLLVDVLGKNPATTVVIIDEVDTETGGSAASPSRCGASRGSSLAPCESRAPPSYSGSARFGPSRGHERTVTSQGESYTMGVTGFDRS